MRILALDQARHGGWSVFEMENKELVDYGEFNFESKDCPFEMVLAKITDLIQQLIQKYDCVALFFEDIQMQHNVVSFKRLAQLQGAILLLCAQNEYLFSLVTPSQWQNYCKARGRTQKEIKSDIKTLALDGKKHSKVLSLEYVCDTYGVETSNDNVSDAICIGTYVVNNITIRTKGDK